jgi:hypothetical protein
VRFVWREVGDRPLEFKVMKLPYVGAEEGQRDETKEKVETVSVAVDNKHAESPGDGAKCKRQGRRKWQWTTSMLNHQGMGQNVSDRVGEK